jgi:hypothetical protein
MFQSAKLKSTYKPMTDDKERLKLAFSTAISALQTGVRITQGIASDVGIGPPGLQAGLSDEGVVRGLSHVTCRTHKFMFATQFFSRQSSISVAGKFA